MVRHSINEMNSQCSVEFIGHHRTIRSRARIFSIHVMLYIRVWLHLFYPNQFACTNTMCRFGYMDKFESKAKIDQWDVKRTVGYIKMAGQWRRLRHNKLFKHRSWVTVVFPIRFRVCVMCIHVHLSQVLTINVVKSKWRKCTQALSARLHTHKCS